MRAMRYLQPPQPFCARHDASERERETGLILKLLALAVCYALAADADAGEAPAMRVLAASGATGKAAARAAPPPATRYGEPQVLSALGEPVDVRVPLLGEDEVISTEARYVLGHAETRLGLPLVRNANIRVVKDAGGWALRVRSASVNHEPALALVIQEQLPSGTLSRVMPLLFDPSGKTSRMEPAVTLATNDTQPAQAALPVAKLRAAPPLKPRVSVKPHANTGKHRQPNLLATTIAAPAPLRLATTLAPAANHAEANRESMRWLRRALLEETDRASLLAMGRKMNQLVAQVEAMEARIAALQLPSVSQTATAPVVAPARQSRRPG